MKRLIILAAAVVAISSCTKGEFGSSEIDKQVEVKFAAAEIGTRTTANEWDKGDRIGISMYISDDVKTPLTANNEFSTDVNGLFTEEGNAIYYPIEGKVDFYAYYPYQNTANEGIYKANIANQTDQGAIDFMCASIKGEVKSETKVQKFTFDHALAQIEINISHKLSLPTLEGVKVKLRGVNSKADFSTLTGKIVENTSSEVAELSLNVAEQNVENVSTAVASAILIPETMPEGAELVFTVPVGEGTAEFTASIEGEVFTAGKIRSYTVSLGANEVEFLGSTLKEWIITNSGDLPSDEVYPD